MTECVFCDEAASGPNANFARRYPELSGRIIWSGERLFAMPCIGQLRPGHFMVLPRSHLCTLSDADAALGRLGAEIAEGIEQVACAIGMADHPLVVFEHGARLPADGGCGIYHAHLHVVPLYGRIDAPAVFGFDRAEAFDNLDDLLASSAATPPYALAGVWGETLYRQNLSAPLPSQHMRRRLATVLGQDRWDWREAGREAGMLNALAAAQRPHTPPTKS